MSLVYLITALFSLVSIVVSLALRMSYVSERHAWNRGICRSSGNPWKCVDAPSYFEELEPRQERNFMDVESSECLRLTWPSLWEG